MVKGVDCPESILGAELFRKYVAVILTDRGGEFAYADEIERQKDGVVRTRVFY